MTNIAIPAAIYGSVEKYDQSAEAKFRQLQQKKETQRKSSALVGPEYMFDISSEECSCFNKSQQASLIKDILTSIASDRMRSASTSNFYKGDTAAKAYESLWNSLTQKSKDYLSYFSLDSNLRPYIDQCPTEMFPAIKGLIYVYKKIWVGMYFGNLQNGAYKKDKLIDYCLMFKQGSKATNLKNMDLILEFAESIGYNLTDNRVVFDQVAMKNGDVFIRAQLSLTKGYSVAQATKAINDHLTWQNSDITHFYSDKPFVFIAKLGSCYSDQFWDALCPFASELSIKLTNSLRSCYRYFPQWYPWLSADFTFNKTNFYPQGYENYIGSNTQPDAKKFIEYIKYSLEASLICMLSYKSNYVSYQHRSQTITDIYNNYTSLIHSFIQKINTPKFRSLVHIILAMVDSLPEEDFIPLAMICASKDGRVVKYLYSLIKGMFYFHSVWPDAPIDLFYATLDDNRSYVLALVGQVMRDRGADSMHNVNYGIDKLSKILNTDLEPLKFDVWESEFLGNDFIDSFLKDHISPSTFIEWIKAAVSDCKERHLEQFTPNTKKQITEMITSETHWVRYYNMGAIKDTFEMIQQYKYANPDLRIDCRKSISLENMEQALIQYGIDNDKSVGREEVLPMDLFPNAVEVKAPGFDYRQTEGFLIQTWKFLQPRTTKILEVWGRQVRNCIGSSTSYYRSMKAHKALIILACLENKPRITIYARLHDQKLTFDQVKDRMNVSLNPSQTAMLESALAQAINQLMPAEQASA